MSGGRWWMPHDDSQFHLTLCPSPPGFTAHLYMIEIIMGGAGCVGGVSKRCGKDCWIPELFGRSAPKGWTMTTMVTTSLVASRRRHRTT
ncbi:hypothetical protein DMENIID0001_018310 [Sergentomyia squamirostris]